MKSPMLPVLTFLLISICGVSGASKKEIKHYSAVVALVNGDPIIFGEIWKRARRGLEYAREEWSGPDEQFGLYLYQRLRLVRNNFINDSLLLKKVMEKGIKISKKQVDLWVENEIEYLNKQGKNITSIEDYWRAMEESFGISEKEYRKEMEKQIKIQEFIRNFVWQPEYFSPRLVRTYYKENQEKFRTVGYVTIRHIFVSRRKKNFDAIVEEIKRAISSGESFEKIARRAVERGYSYRTGSDGAGKYKFSVGKTEKSSKTGKDCDGAIEEQLIPVLQKQVKLLKVGQVSDPILILSGTHFIKVVNREYGRTKTFAEVQGLIQKDLRRKFQQESEEKYIKKLKEKADIELFPFPKDTPLGELPDLASFKMNPKK